MFSNLQKYLIAIIGLFVYSSGFYLYSYHKGYNKAVLMCNNTANINAATNAQKTIKELTNRININNEVITQYQKENANIRSKYNETTTTKPTPHTASKLRNMVVSKLCSKPDTAVSNAPNYTDDTARINKLLEQCQLIRNQLIYLQTWYHSDYQNYMEIYK